MKHKKAIKKELSHINNIDDTIEYIIKISREASVQFLSTQLIALKIGGGTIKELLDEDNYKTWDECYNTYMMACDMFDKMDKE